MSVADLKARLADVVGIETLTMRLEAGRIMLRWGSGPASYAAAADASASDHEIEIAVRNAIRLPPLTLIVGDQHIPQLIPASAPASTPSPKGPTMSNPADTVGALDRVMSDHVRLMGDIHQAQLKILEASLARQRDSVARGVGNFVEKIEGQTDDFEAMMSRYSNSFGA